MHLSALTALAVLTFACMVWSGIAVRPPTLTTLLIGLTMAVAIIAALGPTLLGWGVAEALLRTRYLNGFNFD